MFRVTPLALTGSRIQAEGRKDGERNIPEMGSYQPSPFEQALVAHGERKIQRVFERTATKIGRLQSLYEASKKQWEELESRLKTIQEGFNTRKQELGRDLAIPFPHLYYWALMFALAIGEFSLNTFVFRMFDQSGYLSYVMATALALTVPLLGMFIGIHLRQSIPQVIGNTVIALLPIAIVAGAIMAIGFLRPTDLLAEGSPVPGMPFSKEPMVYALFAINSLIFGGAMVASFFSHDPDDKLDYAHSSLLLLDGKRNKIRRKLLSLGNQINSEIKKAKSQVAQVRELTNERVNLYRHTNIRHRQLLPPPTFRKNPEFREIEWWPEISYKLLERPPSQAYETSSS